MQSSFPLAACFVTATGVLHAGSGAMSDRKTLGAQGWTVAKQPGMQGVRTLLENGYSTFAL